MMNKKGQGLSLNVIIIAAIALIVLVVLIAIFTGRVGVFEKGVSKESQAELIKLKIQYDDCRPSATAEADFSNQFSGVESVAEKEQVKANFVEEWINRCGSFTDKTSCDAGSCKWK